MILTINRTDEENVLKQLKKNRPQITDTTANTYLSNLRTIFKKVATSDDKFDASFFKNNSNRVLEYLNELGNSTRKTKLASLVVICGSHPTCEKYREPMVEEIKEYEDNLHLNKKSSREKINWISQDEVKELYNSYERDVAPLFTKVRKGEELSKSELHRLGEFITLSIYVLQPPRRIRDYTEFKIRDINPKSDNYLKGKKFIFNKYKTERTHGRQEVDVNPKLLKYLKLWLKVNPTDYLLFDTRMSKLSQPQLTQRLNNIFGKRVSVNMLRHIFITDELGDDINRLEKRAEEMGHNLDTQRAYVKKD